MDFLGRYLIVGGLIPKGVVSSDFNADNVTENGLHILYGNGSGTPTKYGILLTIRAAATGNYAYWGMQLFFTSNTGKMYFRVGISNQSAYGNWSDGV